MAKEEPAATEVAQKTNECIVLERRVNNEDIPCQSGSAVMLTILGRWDEEYQICSRHYREDLRVTLPPAAPRARSEGPRNRLKRELRELQNGLPL